MNKDDQRKFQAIRIGFVQSVDAIEMLGCITCLSDHTMDTVRNSQTCHNGSKNLSAQKLFEALKCRPDGLQQAADALRQCGFDDLANELEPQPRKASTQHHPHDPQRYNSLQEPMSANFRPRPPASSSGTTFPESYHGNPNTGAAPNNQYPASFRPHVPNFPVGFNHRYPNSGASPRNENPTPIYPYEQGRNTVPNFQWQVQSNLYGSNSMSATYPGASTVGLPRPTWSLSQKPNPQHQQETYDRNAPSANSAPTMSAFGNSPQGDQYVQDFGGKNPSMEPMKPFSSVGSQNTGDVIEKKNDLNITNSDTENEDSDIASTAKKNIDTDEYNFNTPHSDSNKGINNQENTSSKPTLKSKEVGVEEKSSSGELKECSENVPVNSEPTGFDSSQTTLKAPVSEEKSQISSQDEKSKESSRNTTGTGFDSSETTLKSPISDDKQPDVDQAESTQELSFRSEVVKEKFVNEIASEDVENIRKECFSNVYSQTDSQLPSASDVSTEKSTNVEAPELIDHSMEVAKIPEMGWLHNSDELNDIKRKAEKANAFGICSLTGEDGESYVSNSEESGSVVNYGEDFTSTDDSAMPGRNTVGPNTDGINEYLQQMNWNDHSPDQAKNNNVHQSENGTAESNDTDNQQEHGEVSTSDGIPVPSIQYPPIVT